MASSDRLYLVHIRLGTLRPLIDRIRETIPGVRDELTRLSDGRLERAWSEENGSIHQFFVVTNLTAGQIIGRLNAPDRPDIMYNRSARPRGSSLDPEDQIAVMEIGDDFAEQRLPVPMAWLKRQHSKLNPK